MLLVDLPSNLWMKLGYLTIIAVTGLLGLFAIGAGLNGFLRRRIPAVLRIILVLAGLLLIHPNLVTDLIGFAVVLGSFLWLRRGTVDYRDNVSVV
jgi:TRAP-type uncharacterized transport system fused permease subunit